MPPKAAPGEPRKQELGEVMHTQSLAPLDVCDPIRLCNGGPHLLAGWCGKTATRVGNADGLQWFCCDDPAHDEGWPTEPIAVFFVRALGTIDERILARARAEALEEAWLAEDAVARIRSLTGEEASR